MLKYKWGILCFLFISITLAGCSGKNPGKDEKSEKFQSDYMDLGGMGTKVDEGLFYSKNGLFYYTDFETNTAVPICNKPDCRHLSTREDKNTTCNAANDDSTTIFPYQGKLYGIESREDGIGFFVSELDGSNRKSKENFIDAGCIFQTGIIVRDKLYYLYDETIDIVESDGIQEVTLKWHFNVLDLKSMKQEEILSEETDYIGLLGGTTEYMVYSVIRESEPSFYYFDYKTKKAEEISLISDGYEEIYPVSDGKSFYYIGGEKKLSKNVKYKANTVYQYHVDTKENEVCVSGAEVRDFIGEDAELILLYGVVDEGIVFWAHPQNRMLFKEKESGRLRELSLPENLPVEGARLNSVVCQTEQGVYFDYYIINQESGILGDRIIWYGYISWEDLLSGKNDVKVVLNPRVSSGGNLVDKDGNVIGTESRAKYD